MNSKACDFSLSIFPCNCIYFRHDVLADLVKNSDVLLVDTASCLWFEETHGNNTVACQMISILYVLCHTDDRFTTFPHPHDSDSELYHSPNPRWRSWGELGQSRLPTVNRDKTLLHLLKPKHKKIKTSYTFVIKPCHLYPSGGSPSYPVFTNCRRPLSCLPNVMRYSLFSKASRLHLLPTKQRIHHFSTTHHLKVIKPFYLADIGEGTSLFSTSTSIAASEMRLQTNMSQAYENAK